MKVANKPIEIEKIEALDERLCEVCMQQPGAGWSRIATYQLALGSIRVRLCRVCTIGLAELLDMAAFGIGVGTKPAVLGD